MYSSILHRAAIRRIRRTKHPHKLSQQTSESSKNQHHHNFATPVMIQVHANNDDFTNMRLQEASSGLKRSMPCPDLISLCSLSSPCVRLGTTKTTTTAAMSVESALESSRMLDEAIASLLRSTVQRKRRCVEDNRMRNRSGGALQGKQLLSPATAALNAALISDASDDSEEDCCNSNDNSSGGDDDHLSSPADDFDVFFSSTTAAFPAPSTKRLAPDGLAVSDVTFGLRATHLYEVFKEHSARSA